MDQFSPRETGRQPGNNMYGAHPFYMFQLQNPDLFAAVLLLNSNPMDVKVQHLGLVTELDHVMIGGILDMFFIFDKSAESVIQEYHRLIGFTYIPPYWSFGYHQSKWGYQTLDILK